MEQNGAWKNDHGLPLFSPTHITHELLHHQQQQEQEEVEKEEEYRKKMKLNGAANWLGLADNTCYNHFSTKDLTSVSLPPPSFANTRRMDHPILQLHPYHHHQQQQLLPEMAIAESSLQWQLGSNMRGEDNQSRINLTRDGRESLIEFVSTVDEAGGGRAHKWYNNSPKDEWERRVGLGSNHDMVDPTGFLSNNNIDQSFMNYRGNSSNSNYNAAVMKGSGSSSGSNSKDRHSKVFTAKGVRDRRIRLAVSTATQFYDIQDRLGYEQPSKAVDWLMSKARASIDQLPTMQPDSTLLSRRSTASLELPIATVQPNSDASHQYGRASHRIQDISGKPHAEEEEEEVKVVSGV